MAVSLHFRMHLVLDQGGRWNLGIKRKKRGGGGRRD
jgi:hypothetical protein